MEERRKTFDPKRTFPEIYSGTPTFMGLPAIRKKEEIAGHDAVVMGAPFEGIVTWGSFTGCELAPKSIRNASARYGGFLPEMGFDVFDYLSVGDYGDAETVPGNIPATLAKIGEKAEAVVSGGAVPFTFGGDHSITVPVVAALAGKSEGKVGIIHLDAHLDNIDLYGEERYARCSPLHRIYEIENIDPANIVHLGIRGPRNNKDQVACARERGATILTSFDVKREGLESVAERTLNIVQKNTDAVYVTVCSDILDVAHNPGGPPDPCGLSTFELSRLLYQFASAGIAGFDFVEVYPLNDTNNISSHVAAWMALYAMAGLVKNRFPQLPD
jgi:agmatinase